MDLNRKIGRIAGLFIIIGMVAGVLSVVPAVDDPEYLYKVAANRGQVIRGALFQFIMIPAYVGFALLLYPTLRKYNEGLALGFVGFRVMAGVFHFIGVIILPLFLILSQEFLKAGAPDASYFQILGGLLREGRDLVNHVAMILSLSLGGAMFYYIMYRSRLIPRWLSLWGLLGTALAILASLLLLFRYSDVITPLYIGLNLPMALEEMVLAIWLFLNGFEKRGNHDGG
jgi:hypothetical protein